MGAGITVAGAPYCAPSSRCSPVLLVAAMALLLLWRVATPADALCDEGDKQILLALKSDLGNPADLASWKKDTDCCDTWGSMECDNGGRVTVVDIQSTNATGSIPASIGELTNLQRLVIRKCSNLTGPIPDEISKLGYLYELNLEMNNLTGSIPESIGQLYNLAYLSLSQNNLTGEIPSSIGGLYSLRDFYLDSNKLTGPVPSSFEGLDLERTNLSFNRLSGDASPLFGFWKKTKTIDISGNAFAFDLSEVEFPEQLSIFNMRDNSVYGGIPANADDMKDLQQFNVSHNQLSGEIPQGGVINQFPASAFAYNLGLCGSPLAPCPELRRPAAARRIGPSYPVEVSR